MRRQSLDRVEEDCRRQIHLVVFVDGSTDLVTHRYGAFFETVDMTALTLEVKTSLLIPGLSTIQSRHGSLSDLRVSATRARDGE